LGKLPKKEISHGTLDHRIVWAGPPFNWFHQKVNKFRIIAFRLSLGRPGIPKLGSGKIGLD